MGTLGGNGGQPPNGGGSSDGVPELPPEWGSIVIPDDASELDDEASVIRRRLRWEARQTRWRRRLHLRPARPPGLDDVPSLGVPLVIMAIAVVATLISLFAVVWPGRSQQPPGHPGAINAAGRPLTLPDLVLLDTDGVALRIRDAAPAVVLLVDGCECARLINEASDLVDPRVVVLVVTTGATAPSGSPKPSGTPIRSNGGVGSAGPAVTPSAAAASVTGSPHALRPGVRVRTLFDPTGGLRSAIPGLPTGVNQASVLLVSADWAVVRVVPTAASIAELKADLERLVN
jgi:hypothetical protein